MDESYSSKTLILCPAMSTLPVSSWTSEVEGCDSLITSLTTRIQGSLFVAHFLLKHFT